MDENVTPLQSTLGALDDGKPAGPRELAAVLRDLDSRLSAVETPTKPARPAKTAE